MFSVPYKAVSVSLSAGYSNKSVCNKPRHLDVFYRGVWRVALTQEPKVGESVPSIYGMKRDRTKTRNELGNRSKNGSIEFEICSPSGRGKSLHGRGLSALVTGTSIQASPLATPCAAS